FAVMDPSRDDFKDSARAVLDRADALVMHQSVEPSASDTPQSPVWMKLPANLLREVPSVSQREGERLPVPLQVMVRRALEGAADVKV
ncbi:MAG: hypothetical protein ABLQ96_12940, partial [Candidatus Acidiferrum sp.]